MSTFAASSPRQLLPEGDLSSVLNFLLNKYEVREPGTGTVPTIDTIVKDEEFQRLIDTMAEKSSATKEEKNTEAFDEDRCSARKWESEGGLGYDNIQCSSCKKVSSEEAEGILEEFKGKMTEDQLASLPKYLEKYDGCYCKNHIKQDFFMPNGWWLGKVNEPRPEEPKLPKGSFKDGYQEDYKEHKWMFGSDGKKVEKSSTKIVKKKKKPVQKEEPVQEKKIVKKKKKSVQKEEPKVEKEEEKKDRPYIFEGIEYTEVWNEDDKEWLITFDDKHVGSHFLGSIRFADDDEEKAHSERVAQIKEVEEEPKEEDTLTLPSEEKVSIKIEEDTDSMSSAEEELEEDEEDYEAAPYDCNGKAYMKVWDTEEKHWSIVDPITGSFVGLPDGNGGIEGVEGDEE